MGKMVIHRYEICNHIGNCLSLNVAQGQVGLVMAFEISLFKNQTMSFW